jgi:hypothetical protein
MEKNVFLRTMVILKFYKSNSYTLVSLTRNLFSDSPFFTGTVYTMLDLKGVHLQICISGTRHTGFPIEKKFQGFLDIYMK